MAEPKRYDFKVEPGDCLPLSFNVRSTVLNGYGAEFALSGRIVIVPDECAQ